MALESGAIVHALSAFKKADLLHEPAVAAAPAHAVRVLALPSAPTGRDSNLCPQVVAVAVGQSGAGASAASRTGTGADTHNVLRMPCVPSVTRLLAAESRPRRAPAPLYSAGVYLAFVEQQSKLEASVGARTTPGGCLKLLGAEYQVARVVVAKAVCLLITLPVPPIRCALQILVRYHLKRSAGSYAFISEGHALTHTTIHIAKLIDTFVLMQNPLVPLCSLLTELSLII